jgi:hypothetical protein
MVHASDGEACTHFDAIHHEKVEYAHNVSVVLATDGFNPYGLMVAHTHVGLCSLSPSICPPGNGLFDFISWLKHKVPYLACHLKLLLHANNITI